MLESTPSMNSTDARAEAIREAALALSGAAEREAFIGAECGDDLALSARREELKHQPQQQKP